MTTNPDHPFTCEYCNKLPKSDFTIIPGTEDWLTANEKKNLVHVHFGISSWDEASSTAEAEAMEKFIEETYCKTDKQFFLSVDFSRKDDSAAPSMHAMKLYSKILKNPQTDQIVFYTASSAMHALIKIALKMSGAGKKASVVNTHAQANNLYHKWFTTQTV